MSVLTGVVKRVIFLLMYELFVGTNKTVRHIGERGSTVSVNGQLNWLNVFYNDM